MLINLVPAVGRNNEVKRRIMRSMHKDKICLLAMILVLSLCIRSEAKAADYYFDGHEFAKVDRNGGKKEKTSYCKGKFDVEQLGLSLYELVNDDDPSVDVSPDEKYFVFSGRANKNSDFRYFIADVIECKVVRELVFNKADNAYKPSKPRTAAIFSADSKKLYISWSVWNNKNIKDPSSTSFWLTKEYSETNFAHERTLKNVVIPGKILSLGKFRHPYRFSQDGKSIVVAKNEKDWDLSIYDLQRDEVSFRAKKLEDYIGHKRYFKGEYVPDILDGLLLFNFETDNGAEINIFDYRNKRIENKIDVPEKGLGIFSSKGDNVIVSTFPDPKTMKKRALVYERKTGRRKGIATLDASDEAADVSDDGKHIILKNGKHAAMEHND